MSFAAELEARAQRQKLRRMASQNSLTPAKQSKERKKIERQSSVVAEDEEANDVLDLLDDTGGAESPGPVDEDSIFLRVGGESDGNETDDSDVSSVMSIDPAPQIPHRASKGENTNTHRERKASPLAAPPSGWL